METTPTPTNIQIVWEFDLPDPDDMAAHDKFAEENGIPTIVDLNDYFEDPSSVTNDHITDALSDDHGWLIMDWDYLDACNNDNDDGMINQPPQPINPLEDNMENSPTPTNNNEVPMSSQDLIVQLFSQFIDDGGSPKVTEFKRHIDGLIKSDIKPLCGRSAKSADGTDWRSQLKARFSGKGAKWVIVPLQEVSTTISQLEADGVDCDSYKTFTELKGAAWIRFSGPRLDPNGKQAAAFEVRTGGSKEDHPKQLHFITLDVLDETISQMEGTPHSLKYEVIAQPEEEETTQNEEVETEVVEAAQEVEPDSLEDVFEDFMDDDELSVEDDDELFAQV